MKRVVRIGQGRKVKEVSLGAMQALPGEGAIDSLVEVIQALIPLGLWHVAEALQREVQRLAGPRYSREGRKPGLVRWGGQPGSIYLADQKLPIPVPRVRDLTARREVPLETYQRLQQPRQADRGLLLKVLRGLSCRHYAECAEAVPAAFGLSPSTISRRFIRASARKLRELCERRLDPYDFVALILDGKSFAEDAMVIALGITLTGEKVLLGFVQTGTENERVCTAFLRALVERGLRAEQGLLCVIDGAKGLRKAIRQVFGPQAAVQRCQWHKRENVVSYAPKTQQAAWRRRLQAAYGQPSYPEARAALQRLRQELRLVNASAVTSLDEGVEETLTLHRLGLFEALGRSLTTTNCLESIMAQVGQRTDKVDHWRTSDQKQRWVATPRLSASVHARLALRWSPEQIARRLLMDSPEDPTMRASHETIYTSLDVLPRGELKRELLGACGTGGGTGRVADIPMTGAAACVKVDSQLGLVWWNPTDPELSVSYSQPCPNLG